MFERVLIANRGEIACRVAAALRELGVRSVAVHSAADRGALHTRVADEAIEIGPAEPGASYLDAAALIAAARRARADAIHPGYGFLAESAEFAAAVEGAGLAFIGPTPEQIRALGDKRRARAIAESAGVPVVPGVEAQDPGALAEAARRLGYPVVVKPALGGGGKGMKVVADEAGLREAAESATRLAAAAFGDGALYLEKRLERPRHVEVQVLGDGKGAAIHLFERECTLQRRHQKVVEECPSPAVSEAVRERLTHAAVALAEATRYRGAGTVEFLLLGKPAASSGSASRGRAEFYFLEMNTRLQVEHPVTELVTGVDLVRAQLRVAAEGRLPLAQSEVARSGHAIGARVYAEDAARNFLPQAGTAVKVRWARAPFVRADAGIESGDRVPVHYDPILGKVVASGAHRAESLQRLTAALDATLVHGIATNLPFLRALLRSPEVARAAFDTEWIEREFLAGFAALATAPVPDLALVAASIAEALGAGRGDAAGSAGDGRSPGADPARVFRALGRWRLPGLD